MQGFGLSLLPVASGSVVLIIEECSNVTKVLLIWLLVWFGCFMCVRLIEGSGGTACGYTCLTTEINVIYFCFFTFLFFN